jgi:hypothetical protein
MRGQSRDRMPSRGFEHLKGPQPPREGLRGLRAIRLRTSNEG